MKRPRPSSSWFGRARGFVLGAVIVTAGGLAVAQVGTPSQTRTIGQAADDYPHGEACVSGIAINVTFGSVCTHACVVHADCPTNWGCKGVPQGNGETIKLCFPRRIGAPEN